MTERVVIEDFCPLAHSIEWRLGQRYWQEGGSKAFLSDLRGVPYVINNDGTLSSNAANLLFAQLLEAEEDGQLPSQIFALELGVGVGLFARYFLDAFQELCQQGRKDYYDRLCYIAADRSERMLWDFCRHGVLHRHAGHYQLRVLEAPCPDGKVSVEAALGGLPVKPLQAVFLNYLLDCLPASVLRVCGSELQQLCVQTCLARGVKLGAYTDRTVLELARWASSHDSSHQRELMECFPALASEYDFRPVDLATLALGDFAARFGESCVGEFVHSYGAIYCLQELLHHVCQNGFILINDYGSTSAAQDGEFEHQRFSNATGVGVNFALLKSYFTEGGKHQWLAPSEHNGHIYSCLLGDNISPATSACFQEHFGKTAFDWHREPADTARAYLKQGRYDAAATAYGEALARELRNWALMAEVARFLTFTLRNPNAGYQMSKAALSLNPTCSSDLWNTLGDSLFMLGRVDDARSAFHRAIRINPNDVRARYNLSFVHIRENDLEAALKSIAEGLALDKAGEFREGLLQKQSEVLRLIAQLDQQECEALANRISRRYYHGKPRPDGTAGVQPGVDGKDVALSSPASQPLRKPK